jgi:hypothetical protein
MAPLRKEEREIRTSLFHLDVGCPKPCQSFCLLFLGSKKKPLPSGFPLLSQSQQRGIGPPVHFHFKSEGVRRAGWLKVDINIQGTN